MSAIAIGSHRLWAPLIGALFNSFVVYYFTYSCYRQYLSYRLRHKVSSRNENYSVMITNVPEEAGDEIQLRPYFEALFPGQVVNIVRARNTAQLEKDFKKRGKVLRKMEKSYWVQNDTGKRSTNRIHYVGKKVDSIEYYTAKFNELENNIATEQQRNHNLTGVVFVTFNTVQAAMQCSRLVIAPFNKYQTQVAPEPRDVLWKNLSITEVSRLVRTALAAAFTFILVLFFMIGVIFISGLANLNTLAQVSAFHFLARLETLSPVITGFIEGYIPTLILLIFYLLLAPVLKYVSRLQGFYTRSAVDVSLMHKYHVFQVYNIFLIYSISGSAIAVLQQLMNDPGMIPNLLATSLPQQSFFFINYIMLLSLSNQARALARPNALVIVWIKKRFLAKSPRAVRECQNPGMFNYGVPAATHLLVFLIVLFYSTIAPFVLIFGLIYFAMVYVVTRYNLIYVFEPQYEGGGFMWPSIFHRIMVAVVIYQLALVGEFGLYRFTAGAIIIGIMAFVTGLFWYIVHYRFRDATQYGCLHQLVASNQVPAVPREHSENVIDVADSEPTLNRNAYHQPTLQKPKPNPELPGQPADPEEDKNDPSLNYGMSSGISSLSTAHSLGGGNM